MSNKYDGSVIERVATKTTSVDQAKSGGLESRRQTQLIWRLDMPFVIKRAHFCGIQEEVPELSGVAQPLPCTSDLSWIKSQGIRAQRSTKGASIAFSRVRSLQRYWVSHERPIEAK